MSMGDPPPFMPWNDVTGYLPLAPSRLPQVGDIVTIDARGFIYIDPPSATDDVPNRLYGVTINSEGEAI